MFFESKIIAENETWFRGSKEKKKENKIKKKTKRVKREEINRNRIDDRSFLVQRGDIFRG